MSHGILTGWIEQAEARQVVEKALEDHRGETREQYIRLGGRGLRRHSPLAIGCNALAFLCWPRSRKQPL